MSRGADHEQRATTFSNLAKILTGCGAAIVAFSATFQAVAQMPVAVRTLIVGACAVTVVVLVTGLLSLSVRPRMSTVLGSTWIQRKHKLVLAGALTLLVVIVLMFGRMFELSATLHSVVMRSVLTDTASLLLLDAPMGLSPEVRVAPEADRGGDCIHWTESEPQAEILTEGRDSPVPLIRLRNFSHPQTATIQCDSDVTLNVSVLSPVHTSLLSSEDLSRLRWLTIFAGGALCIACSTFLSLCWSQSAPKKPLPRPEQSVV